MSDIESMRGRLRPDGGILLALQMVQDSFGYVPQDALPLIVDVLNVSRAEVHGVLTYYSDLRTEPPAPVVVRICAGEACQAVGARAVHHELDKIVPAGVEVNHVYCLGNCALGPAAMVDGEVYGFVTAAELASRASEAAAAKAAAL